MKTHITQIGGLFIVMVLLTIPAWAEPAESEPAVERDAQRAACDARCREDFQSNASASQACLRDCGAIGPATAAATSDRHEAAHIVQQQAGATTVKSSKSNSNERPPRPQATTVKGSKSNSDNRSEAPPPPTPVEASNLNLSKSNIDREAEDDTPGTTEDFEDRDDEDLDN